MQILSASGKLLYCSESLSGQHLPPSAAALALAQRGRASFYTAGSGASSVRVYQLPVSDSLGKLVWIVQVARSLKHVTEATGVLKRLALAGGLVTLLATGLVAFFTMGKALTPIVSLTQVARGISASGEFGRRVPVGADRGDELVTLQVAFNEMLASLERAHEDRTRFLADASHQLRTPLTSLSNNVAFLQRWDESTASARVDALADMEADTAKMRHLVAQLLSLARRESGPAPQMVPVDLVALAREGLRSIQPLAASRGVSVLGPEADAALTHPPAQGDPASLNQALDALLENAVRYTAPGGHVDVTVASGTADVSLSVADTGIGIPAADHDLVWQAFHRGSNAAAVDPDGVGLGLSIVGRVAGMHGARVTLASVEGKGTTVTLVLPTSGGEAASTNGNGEC